MKIIFLVSGGTGKSIAATAVCKAIKTQYPKSELIVLTGYPAVFERNPNVNMIFGFNNISYFYPQHIEGKDAKLFLHDPYNETDFIYQRGHLIKVWCEMFGIKYNGEMPELYITGQEQAAYSSWFMSPKPLLVIQPSGGTPNKDGSPYSWPRDLPMAIAQKVVNTFAADYNVVHIRRQDQMPLQNVYPVQAEFRMLAVLLMMSEKRLLIDSFAQHAAAALRLPSVVCWVANVPSQFGYDMHTNIIANTPTLAPDYRNSGFSKYNIAGVASEFPYNSDSEIFDADRIIEAIRGDKKQAEAESKKKVKELVS